MPSPIIPPVVRSASSRNSRRRGLLGRLAVILVLAAAVVATFSFVSPDQEADGFLSRALTGLFGANGRDPGDADGKLLPTEEAKPTEPGTAATEKPEPTACDPKPTEEAAPTETPAVEPTETPKPEPTAKPTKAVSTERTAPVLSASASEGRVRLEWNAAKGSGLVGYKVVASHGNATPRYPDDGYYFWITDLSKRAAAVDAGTCYNGGDFDGRMTPGESYWFAITAVYEDAKLTSNAVKVVCPEPPPPPPSPAAPTVSAAASGSEVVLEWTIPEDARLVGFKVVASLENEHPAYPDDGYAEWITDLDCRRWTLSAGSCYNGGDFDGTFVAGTAYWFSVTAVYEIDGCWVKAAGNAVQVTVPGDPPK